MTINKTNCNILNRKKLNKFEIEDNFNFLFNCDNLDYLCSDDDPDNEYISFDSADAYNL